VERDLNQPLLWRTTIRRNRHCADATTLGLDIDLSVVVSWTIM
jgi:hypothetical protein